jgi:hypothetical protein
MESGEWVVPAGRIEGYPIVSIPADPEGQVKPDHLKWTLCAVYSAAAQGSGRVDGPRAE